MDSGRRAVTLYTREGCHLCDQATALLARLAPALGFRIRSVNVDDDPALAARYGSLVPVVAVAGRVVARAPIEQRALRRVLTVALRAEGAGAEADRPPPAS